MIKVIVWCEVLGDHPFATPEEVREEVVEFATEKALDNFIALHTDDYNNAYEKRVPPSFGFDYTSNAGGIKIKDYVPVTIRKI